MSEKGFLYKAVAVQPSNAQMDGLDDVDEFRCHITSLNNHYIKWIPSDFSKLQKHCFECIGVSDDLATADRDKPIQREFLGDFLLEPTIRGLVNIILFDVRCHLSPPVRQPTLFYSSRSLQYSLDLLHSRVH